MVPQAVTGCKDYGNRCSGSATRSSLRHNQSVPGAGKDYHYPKPPHWSGNLGLCRESSKAAGVV